MKYGVLQTLVAVFLAQLMTAAAHASPIVSLAADNTAIETSSFSFNVDGTAITTTEVWTASTGGMLEFDLLDDGVTYTLERTITNSSGENWLDFGVELLDPAGQDTDEEYDLPVSEMPLYVPPGFSTSNNLDGLSFGQAQAVDAISDAFDDVFRDELDERDFLEFFDPNGLNSGETFFVQFGLTDRRGVGDLLNEGHNSPFVLYGQASDTIVSEPAALVLLGLTIAGLAFWRRGGRA